jgi:hypothetical protein
MHVPSPFPATVLRERSPSAECTCEHYPYCNCTCHGRHCDPSQGDTCDIAYLADEGGVTKWGCVSCSPGQGGNHVSGCKHSVSADVNAAER